MENEETVILMQPFRKHLLRCMQLKQLLRSYKIHAGKYPANSIFINKITILK